MADRHNYLLLSLLLCFCLGLVLFAHRRRSAAAASPDPVAADLEPPAAKSYACCLPER